jgi:hypothetical protein
MDQRLEGKEKQQFIAFMRKMLQWNPENREDSEGVSRDEWLLADLIESGEVGWGNQAVHIHKQPYACQNSLARVTRLCHEMKFDLTSRSSVAQVNPPMRSSEWLC